MRNCPAMMIVLSSLSVLALAGMALLAFGAAPAITIRRSRGHETLTFRFMESSHDLEIAPRNHQPLLRSSPGKSRTLTISAAHAYGLPRRPTTIPGDLSETPGHIPLNFPLFVLPLSFPKPYILQGKRMYLSEVSANPRLMGGQLPFSFLTLNF